MSQFCILSLCYLHSVTIFLYALVQRNLKPELAIPQFSWLCMSTIPGTITGSCTLWLSPSTLYSFAEYLMLDDEGCINALLLVDFIPSTLYHLFWDMNLESFFECLETCSHQWWVLSPSIVLGIHQCPLIDRSSQCSTLTHLFTLVSLHSSTLIPIFIIGGWSHVC